jgi:hypothetical protein
MKNYHKNVNHLSKKIYYLNKINLLFFLLIRKQITELEVQRDQLQKTNNHILQEVNSLKSNIDQQINNKREQNPDLNKSSQTIPRKILYYSKRKQQRLRFQSSTKSWSRAHWVRARPWNKAQWVRTRS